MLKKLRIALYDQDGYMAGLAEYLCRKKAQILETQLFTAYEIMEQCARKGEIDVLLAGEEIAGKISALSELIPQIILLSEEQDRQEAENCFFIFRYQSVENILREVLAQTAENDKISCKTGKGYKKTAGLYAVYAPFGGSGVTRHALAIAKGFSEKHRTLYVNLELFHGLDAMISEKQENTGFYCGMSEVLFYIKQRKERLALKLESVVYPLGGPDGIAAVEDCRDLYSMSLEDMQQFLKVLEEQTDYEKIVFDIGYLNDAVLYLMSQCNEVYMPHAVTESQKSKEQAFRRFLLRGNYVQLEQEIREVSLC